MVSTLVILVDRATTDMVDSVATTANAMVEGTAIVMVDRLTTTVVDVAIIAEGGLVAEELVWLNDTGYK